MCLKQILSVENPKMFVSLNCHRWSIGNSDTFIFAAPECWGEKGHFQVFCVYLTTCRWCLEQWCWEEIHHDGPAEAAEAVLGCPWELSPGKLQLNHPHPGLPGWFRVFLAMATFHAALQGSGAIGREGMAGRGCLAGSTGGSQEDFLLGWGCSFPSPVQAGTETAPLWDKMSCLGYSPQGDAVCSFLALALSSVQPSPATSSSKCAVRLPWAKLRGNQLLWWVLEKNTKIFYWPRHSWPLASVVFDALGVF